KEALVEVDDPARVYDAAHVFAGVAAVAARLDLTREAATLWGVAERAEDEAGSPIQARDLYEDALGSCRRTLWPKGARCRSRKRSRRPAPSVHLHVPAAEHPVGERRAGDPQAEDVGRARFARVLDVGDEGAPVVARAGEPRP